MPLRSLYSKLGDSTILTAALEPIIRPFHRSFGALMNKILWRVCALFLLGLIGTAQAQSIVIDKAVARATVGKMPNGAAFLQIENKGADDALLSGSSPASSRIEIHTMSMEGDVMKMRALDQLELKSGQRVEMKPGSGIHIMLMGLKKPLAVGEKFPLTLNFRKAGKIETTVEVVEMKMPMKKGEMHEHHGHHQHHKE
jgi:copper(I)-binding protein